MLAYFSTRNKEIKASPSEAILRGLAPDGGLFVPSDLKELSLDWEKTIAKDYRGMAEEIFAKFFPDITDDIPEVVAKSYEGKFDTEDITPLKKLKDGYILELFHGPTCAFKDVALSALPNLMRAAAAKEGLDDEILILTATSGDTGSAAMRGFSGVNGTTISVFYPDEGISEIQRLQMTTQEAKNVSACAIRGNFDAAQRGVKEIFRSMSKPAQGVALSSANSINIGRLVPQIVYYFAAYKQLVESGDIERGERISFTVPTGNFGDIMAGWFAKEMGLPIGRLVCASNRNDVLEEFINTGHYDINRNFYSTTSPSMDILISSNLERLLFYTCSDANTASYMKSLEECGEYDVTAAQLENIKSIFAGASSSDEEGNHAIRALMENEGYLIDPHTAIGCASYAKFQQSDRAKDDGCKLVNVVLATASPYKFPVAVMKALGISTSANDLDNLEKLERVARTAAPPQLKGVFEKEVVSSDVIDPAQMKEYVRKKVNDIG